eukprot:Gb_08244 [translate_table: standard]
MGVLLPQHLRNYGDQYEEAGGKRILSVHSLVAMNLSILEGKDVSSSVILLRVWRCCEKNHRRMLQVLFTGKTSVWWTACVVSLSLKPGRGCWRSRMRQSAKQRRRWVRGGAGVGKVERRPVKTVEDWCRKDAGSPDGRSFEGSTEYTLTGNAIEAIVRCCRAAEKLGGEQECRGEPRFRRRWIGR